MQLSHNVVRRDVQPSDKAQSERFVLAWMLWKNKRHEPLEKIRVTRMPDGGVIVGILDYVTLEQQILLSDSVFPSYESAFAAVGRAVDAGLKHDKHK